MQLFPLITHCVEQSKTENPCAIEDNALIICNKSADNPADDHLIMPIFLADEITPEYLFILSRRLGFSIYRFVPEDFLLKCDAQEEFDDYIYLKRISSNSKQTEEFDPSVLQAVLDQIQSEHKNDR